MKRIISFFLSCVLLCGLVTSCFHDDELAFTYSEGNVFVKVFYGQNDYENMTNPLPKSPAIGKTWVHPEDLYEHNEFSYKYTEPWLAGSFVDLYVDARWSDGSSNWRYPKKYDWYVSSTIAIKDDEEKDTDDNTMYITITPYKSVIDDYANRYSPPTQLHLVLDSYDEFEEGVVPSKTWKVDEIKVGGVSKINDPDWAFFLDNRFCFFRNGTFEFYPGETLSESEKQYFTDKDDVVYGTYSFTRRDRPRYPDFLHLSFAGGKTSFHNIESSGWNEIRILVPKQDGVMGTVTLVPDDN